MLNVIDIFCDLCFIYLLRTSWLILLGCAGYLRHLGQGAGDRKGGMIQEA